jgi:hypothetical protein
LFLQALPGLVHCCIDDPFPFPCHVCGLVDAILTDLQFDLKAMFVMKLQKSMTKQQ